MSRGARRKNESVESVFKEAEQNLLSAFAKSGKTRHRGLKGNARAHRIEEFLGKRLPSEYGVRCNGEIVDYLDQRSGEFDIVIYDRVRNAVLSDDPLWVPAESALCVIEVKTCLTKSELRKSYRAAIKISSLRPFKGKFTLAGPATETNLPQEPPSKKTALPKSLRCFRAIFAYNTDLGSRDWLAKEWKRVQTIAKELHCEPAMIDRILVLNRGMINPPSSVGTDDLESASVLQRGSLIS
jgi:hypothetical protein